MFEDDHFFPDPQVLRPSIKVKEYTVEEKRKLLKDAKNTEFKEIFNKFPQFLNETAFSKYLELEPLKAAPLKEIGLRYKYGFQGKDGNVYSGQLDDKNRRNGLGNLVIIDGTLHTGYFVTGSIRGRGRRIDTNGVVSHGNFKDGIIKGEGTIAWPYGITYTGNLVEGIPHGEGVEECDDWKFTGNFIRGERHGYGELE